MDEKQQSAALTSANSVEPKNTVAIEEAGPCKKNVVVEIPEDSIRNATDKQYDSLRRDAIVPGFRKGRAPRGLLEKRFGKEVSEQVKLKLLADASDSAIKDNKLAVLREPHIDFEKIELPAAGPLKFDFEVEVRPEFDLPKLDGIPLEKKKMQVTDEQTKGEIEKLQKWAGVWTPREDGKVELDDQIIADVVLKVAGADEEQKLDNIEIMVRQYGFVGAIPVEKLDELLAGARTGDTRQMSVEVPKTYFREEYRGKKVDIRITIKETKSLKPAALDEVFFKRFGVEDKSELQEKIRDMLQSQLESHIQAEMAEQIYKYLLDNTGFDLPLDVVAEHSVTLLQRQYSNLLMRGLSREQVDEQMGQLRASSEQQAKEQLKTLFIMDKIADKLGIDVTEEEINGQIAQLAIRRGLRPERMKETMVRDGSLAQFRLLVRENKCIAKLLESANIIEVEPQKKAKKTKKPAKKTAADQAAAGHSAPTSEKKASTKGKTTTKKKTNR